MVATGYGGPEQLEIGEREVPALAADEVLVRVHAGSLNALDWHRLRGEPYMMRLTDGLRRLKNSAFGADLAGVVEAVGVEVTDLAPGTQVFGQALGALADLVVVKREGVVPLPEGVSLEEGACLGVAALTAIQAVRTRGQVQPGANVLITGAAGGVGMFAVQIAKADGAVVTAETSPGKLDFVRGLGADRVVAQGDGITRGADRFDVIIDCAGWYPIRKLRRILAGDGRLVIVGLGTKNPWAVPLGRFAKMPYVRLTSRQTLITFVSGRNQDDLRAIGELVGSGAVRVHIEHVYPLAQLGAALARLEAREVRGKVVVTLD